MSQLQDSSNSTIRSYILMDTMGKLWEHQQKSRWELSDDGSRRWRGIPTPRHQMHKWQIANRLPNIYSTFFLINRTPILFGAAMYKGKSTVLVSIASLATRENPSDTVGQLKYKQGFWKMFTLMIWVLPLFLCHTLPFFSWTWMWYLEI